MFSLPELGYFFLDYNSKLVRMCISYLSIGYIHEDDDEDLETYMMIEL